MLVLRRQLFHFEFPEDGGGGGPAIADEPAVDPGAGDPAAPAGESFSVSRDEWEALQERFGQVLQHLSQPPQYAQQYGEEPEPQFELDLYSDDAGQQLVSLIQARDAALMEQFQGLLQPLYQTNHEAQVNAGVEELRDIFHDNVAQNGDIAEPDAAFDLAMALGRTIYPEVASRYGAGDRAASIAFDQAIKELRARDEAVGKAYHERKMNELQNLAGAPREPAAAGVGTRVVGGERPDTLADLADRHFPG